MRYTLLILLLFVLFANRNAQAQVCPQNIDFKEGTFNHWACSTGSIDRSGVITFNGYVPVPGRQTIIQNTDISQDFYGKFPVTGPNGSKYSIILGNSVSGAQAEQVSYTYTIPADKTDYVFTYYYAVVLQLTNHQNFERPRFSVKLTDVTTNEIVPCGTHDFVSGDGLGDFKTSVESAPGGSVEYRDWSTVAVNLAGRQGHTIRFDFTTNDCVYQQHFGYAYLSFDDPCVVNKDPITGSNYCRGVNSVTLTAPPGFGSYNWHKANSTTAEGYGRQITLSPVPADGTQYVVDAVSTSGVGAGCPASFKAIIHKIDEDYIFNLQPFVQACETVGIDLTNPDLTATSSPMTFKYYEDINGNVSVRNPQSVVKTGIYYIQGTNSSGCTDVKPINVQIIPSPAIVISPPKPVCVPATIDLTDPAIVGGLDPNATYAYFEDPTQQKPVTGPKKTARGGIYYIKVNNQNGCYNVFPVNVTILDIPKINARTIVGCSPLDITRSGYRDGDTPGLLYSYFKDALATIPVDRPDLVTAEGTYYAVGTNSIGCTTPSPVPLIVNLNSAAVFSVMDPTPVKYPASVDLSNTFSARSGYAYTYYLDSLSTKPLSNYKTVGETGKYYIKATTSDGCGIVRSVKATINEPDPAGILVNNTFTPNGDGINDEFVPILKGVTTVNYLKIYSRNGALVFDTKDLAVHWTGTLSTAQLPQGTYYWVFSGYDNYRKKEAIQSGSVTVIR